MDQIGLLRVSPHLCLYCRCWHVPQSPCPCFRCGQVHIGECDGEIHLALDARMCLLCGAAHASRLSCPCLRCGLRHDGDCATICRHCSSVHRPDQVLCNQFRMSNSRRVRARIENDNCDAVTSVTRHFCGEMNVRCPHCQAKFWPAEKLNCCNSGSIVIPELNEVPVAMSSLILSAHVRQNMRSYNSVMAFASTGHNNKSLVDGTFVLGGRAYHRIGPILPNRGQKHAFAQIYTLDTENATLRRQEIMPTLRAHVLSQLHAFMIRYNVLASRYQSVAADIGDDNDHNDAVGFTWSATEELSRFEVGALIEREGWLRHIIVRRRDGVVRSIHDSHQLYHALAYPLLFPTGSPGWHPRLEHQGRLISLTEYMRFKLMHRDCVTHIQRCERLALEYYCDAWAQVEARCMAFHKLATQQAKYHSASAKVIIDQLCVDNANQIGVPSILPASYPNSPRYYHNLYLDAVALPRRFGKPDLFITMTCNPHWIEIKNGIPPGSHWKHHPDIVARVFNLKLKALLDVVIKKKLFGDVLAFVYRIEWQARGMPHAHILIILKTKVLNARHIDEIVWAEIPCPERYPVLHEIVGRCMIHDPCDNREDAPCRIKSGNGSCYRKFPKSLNRTTSITGDGWPQYRRRGRYVITRNGQTVTDEWVVPFNPMLLEMFDCHVNIEICAHKRCFKYVYKYCFKSPDHATVQIDEIDAYLSGRFLSAGEAVWRFLALRLHNEHPSVIRLDVHLPNHQQVIFDPTADPEDILEAATAASSTLLEWFELNKRDQFARSLLYKDIPEFYIWKNGIWIRRTYESSMAVGRVYGVSMYNYELFALRSLLHCVRGCTSFVDLLTVDGFIHPTFRAACEAFGFIHDDTEFIACFQEFLDTRIASLMETRFQFAFMLMNIKTLNALALFEHFADDLCDGESRSAALYEIEMHFQRNNKSLTDADFNFVLPDSFVDIEIVEDPAITVNAPTMSAEQNIALEHAIDISNDACRKDCTMAIIASAGTGKTVFVHAAVQKLISIGRCVMCVAASALAATLLPNGRTAHAALRVPIEIHNDSYCHWDVKLQNYLRTIDVIFWDEISMVAVEVVDCVDRSLRRLHDNDMMFGGVVMILLGDFRQLTPVVKQARGERHSILNADWFKLCPKFQFTRNFRTTDIEFSRSLTAIGDGCIDIIDIPETSIANDINDLIYRVYGHDISDPTNHKNMILAFTLDQCAAINDAVFSRFHDPPSYSIATDDLCECKCPDEYPHEYIASMIIHGVPPSSLTLQPKARYMLIRNANPPAICNGVLAELISSSRYICKMRLLSGPGKKQVIYLPRFSFRVTQESSGLPFTFTRRQFPIVPAYCVSVHKSQGQSLNRIGFVAEQDAFAHGQVYVALSRVASWHCITFYSPRGETFVKNKVAKELTNIATLNQCPHR